MKKYIKPFVHAVEDYHQFRIVIESFRSAGIPLSYKEVGYGNYKKLNGYLAVFYCVNDKKQKEYANNLIKKLQKKIGEEVEDEQN